MLRCQISLKRNQHGVKIRNNLGTNSIRSRTDQINPELAHPDREVLVKGGECAFHQVPKIWHQFFVKVFTEGVESIEYSRNTGGLLDEKIY